MQTTLRYLNNYLPWQYEEEDMILKDEFRALDKNA